MITKTNIKEFEYLPNLPRYEGKEQQFQTVCADYLRLQHPRLFWCHIANEGRHKVQYRKKMARQGVVSGMPDIMIFNPLSHEYPGGLAIELKTGYNKPTDTQIEVANKLTACGWRWCWVRSFEAFQQLLKQYKN